MNRQSVLAIVILTTFVILALVNVPLALAFIVLFLLTATGLAITGAIKSTIRKDVVTEDKVLEGVEYKPTRKKDEPSTKPKNKEEESFYRFHLAFDPHINILKTKRSNYIKYDDYDNVDTEEWEKELNYFYERVIKSRVSLADLKKMSRMLNRSGKEAIKFYIEKQLQKNNASRNPELIHDVYHESMSGEQYEIFCSSLLNFYLVGHQNDRHCWGLRCRYTGHETRPRRSCSSASAIRSNVGVSAVQEILAGKAYVSANYAAVVSNADYTAAAKELANKTGVMLLHHRQLPHLDSLL